MEEILTLFGFLIIIVNFIDFFHTTLSGKGFGKISGTINRYLGNGILKGKNRFLIRFSGLFHLLITSLWWLFLTMLGTFIIYLSSEEMVVHSQTGSPASVIERFYFTSYVISTLGIGDFVPGSDVSRIATSLLPFTGFILLTMAMTYLISVINVILQKKQLALHISTIGNDIEEIYKVMTANENYNPLTDNASDLKQLIIQNSSNYKFFPMMQYFLTQDKSESLELQLARIYEVLRVYGKSQPEDSVEFLQTQTLLAAIKNYLSMGLEEEDDIDFDSQNLKSLREFWEKRHQNKAEEGDIDRKMNASLRSAGWNWEDVYALESSPGNTLSPF